MIGTEAKSFLCTTSVADELFKEMNALRDVKFDIENRRPEVRRTYQMVRWIENVERIDREVTRFEITYNGRIPCYHSCTFWPNYKLGKEAASKLRRVHELLREKKDLDPQINQQPPDKVKVEVWRTPESFVGREKMMNSVMFQLTRKEGENVIGIYGVDGIGKSMLLQKIKNSFNGNDFDVVIDVIVGENPSISRIQEDIGVQLGYSSRKEETGHHCHRRCCLLPADEIDAARELSGVLEKKNFLLLLDGVNDILDLELVGIPSPNQRNNCKIVLATKSMEVCDAMKAYPIRMDRLSEFDSWSLFCNHLGEIVDMGNQSTRRHIKDIVTRCDGLPLSLITAAKCVANPAADGEWKEVKRKLKKAADGVKLDGLISLYSTLQVEFDGLESKLKECLLYCSIFPENHQIPLEKLVDYWMGEGFLDDDEEMDDIDTVRDQGMVLLTRLQSAFLLEEAIMDGRKVVKMHTSVRKMALHHSNRDAAEREKHDLFLVEAGSGLHKINGVERWAMAKRVSVMYNHIAEIPKLQHSCPELSTLMINHNIDITRVPSDMFEFTLALRVLDVSNTGLKEIPAAIGSLTQLRYLNLSFTYIKSLPEELGQLKKLRQLNLSLTFVLDDISQEAILGLESLQSLNLSGSEYNWGMEQKATGRKQLTLDGLEKLTRLTELGLKIREVNVFGELMKSDRPLKSTRFLELEVVEGLNSGDLSVAFGRMSELKELNISKLEKLQELRFTAYAKVMKIEVLNLSELPLERITACSSELFQSLRRLEVAYCHNLKDLSWVRNLPSLENLTVSHCHQLECIALDLASETVAEIQPVDDRDKCFPKLQTMILSNLPKLRYISEELLDFPLLEMLVVDECLELKELPFDRNGCKMLKHIHGNPNWWNGLGWRYPFLRCKLFPIFSNPWF